VPYKNISELPAQVKSLPTGAQHLWMNAYNFAHKDKKRFPDASARSTYAWGAVKRIYKKSASGKWVKKSLQRPRTDEERAKAHFNISDDEWDKLSPEEKKKYIDKLPPRGTRLEGTDAEREQWELMFRDPESPEEWVRLLFQISKEQWEELTPEEQQIFIQNVPVKLSVQYSSPLFTSGAPFNWQRVGDVLKITGTLIAEGTWTGIDGHTVYYPRAIFPDATPNILSASIKRGHEMDEDAVVGFVSASRFLDDRIDIEGIIYDPTTIQDIELNNLTGISMEADVNADWDESKGCHVANSINLLKATLVERPACDSCRVSTTSHITLESRVKEKRKRKMDEFMLLYAKPSENDFFGLIEEKLRNAKVEDEAITTAMTVLREAVKVPYPYFPAPEAAATSKLSDLQGKVDTLANEKKTLESQLATKTTELDGKIAEITTKDTEITDLKAKNQSLCTQLEDIKKSEVTSLLGRIKEVDKDFNEKELLEGVDSADMQKTLLSKYLGSILKLSKRTNLSVGAGSVTEDKVSQVLLNMGITDIKGFIERQ